MLIRIMATPDQPLWRIFAEIILRLPVIHPWGKDLSGKGRGRLWHRIENEEDLSKSGMLQRAATFELQLEMRIIN